MGSLLGRQKQIELKKRIMSFTVLGGGMFLMLAGFRLLGFCAAGIGLYLGWKWLRFRARNGMRF